MPDNTWDFEISRIAIDNLAIDASSPLGFVLAQPRYDLDANGTPPFRIQTAFRQKQIDVLKKSFLIRQVESTSRQIPVPFIVFPEYSIPIGTPEGFLALQTEINASNNNLVFIAGVEGLIKTEFEELVNCHLPNEEAIRPLLTNGSFVNACVIVIKDNAGLVSWYFQPKIAPSQWEERRGMAEGNKIFYFHSNNIAFLCQLCFDHIAMLANKSLSTVLCERLQALRGSDPTPLDFLFVPQYNKTPSGDPFLKHTTEILGCQNRLFNTDLTAVVAVNRAADSQEPGKFAFSGLHYREGRWKVRQGDLGPNGYHLIDRNGTTSAIFRMRTEAIHALKLMPSNLNVGNRENPRIPFRDVHSYLLSSNCDTPTCHCLPGDTSAAGNFVRCTPLPCKLREALLIQTPTTDTKNRWQSSDATSPDRFASRYSAVRDAILALSPTHVGGLVDLLFCGIENRTVNPDLWIVANEMDAVIELSSILSILSEKTTLSLNSEGPWTAELGATAAVVVLDGYNDMHYTELEKQYFAKYESEYYRPECRSRAVLLVTQRSRGRVDPIVQLRQRDITLPTRTGVSDDADTPFKPRRNKFYLCRTDFFDEVRADATGVTLLNRQMETILE